MALSGSICRRGYSSYVYSTARSGPGVAAGCGGRVQQGWYMTGLPGFTVHVQACLARRSLARVWRPGLALRAVAWGAAAWSGTACKGLDVAAWSGTACNGRDMVAWSGTTCNGLDVVWHCRQWSGHGRLVWHGMQWPGRGLILQAWARMWSPGLALHAVARMWSVAACDGLDVAIWSGMACSSQTWLPRQALGAVGATWLGTSAMATHVAARSGRVGAVLNGMASSGTALTSPDVTADLAWRSLVQTWLPCLALHARVRT